MNHESSTPFGGQSETAPLRIVLMKHVRDAFVGDASIDRQWRDLNYLGRPDLARAIDEYDRLVELVRGLGADIRFVPSSAEAGMDSMYVHDSSIVCDAGAILCNMGKTARKREPAAMGPFYRALGVPVIGRIEDPGTVEGGDVAWLDPRTLAVAEGYRTNAEGIRQLRALLGNAIDELIVVPSPHFRGPGDVFHLMSIVSPVDRDLAVVYSPLMVVPFRERLLARGIQLVEVPEAEYNSMGCNVLAVAPRRCVVLDGNPITRQRLEAAGAEVHAYQGEEISWKGSGGITCLTRPLYRARVS
jgi:N-dimethylarginine dimethylaminohydrolase